MSGAARAREQARAILHERRFRGTGVPRPFHGALVWLGRRLHPLIHAVDRLIAHIPGGGWTFWTIVAALGVLLAATAATAVARRHGLAATEDAERARRGEVPDPRALERSADAAEAAGDMERALRLRYRAGLLRLALARVLPLRESLTSGEARRLLREPAFDALAQTHDEVVYGGRKAQPADAAAARERWPVVLAAKGVRR